jgi:maltooligosyltrehalose synthase
LLATGTHDTKRGEDARARLAVLSEIPDMWRASATDGLRINRGNRTRVQGAWAPDRNDECLFYQALIGAWPAEHVSDPVPDCAPQNLIERMASYRVP